MSIIKYSIENELHGTRKLNQNINNISKSKSSFTGLSKKLPNLSTLTNQDHFTRRLPKTLKENEFNSKQVGELKIGKTPFSILRKNNDRF